MAKEFLGKQAVQHASLNILDEEGRRAWEELGRPLVPCIVVDGRASPVLHVLQLCTALGLPAPAMGESKRLAWDLVPLLESWAGHLDRLDFPVLLEPTRSRGRSIRNLTVNAFHPISQLPRAMHEGVFDWPLGTQEQDDERLEAELVSAQAVRDFAHAVVRGFTAFLVEEEDALGAPLPDVRSGYGTIPFSALLEEQRWHAAFHYRQVVEHLSASGRAVPGVFEMERIPDLELPGDVYG